MHNKTKTIDLNSAEIYTIGILMIYSILALIFWGSLDNALLILLQNFGISAIIIVFSIYSRSQPKMALMRNFILIPFIYYIYSQVHYYVPLINSNLYDALFIKWDYSIFGGNPTEYLYKYSNPILTEYLQFCYMTFFFMPIAHGVELFVSGKRNEYGILVRQILLGFYASYLLYFFMPAIGPRFCLHDFANLSLELPGLWLTEAFRNFVNAGGSIMPNAADPTLLANRDCMPSGHTMMTVMNIYLAFRFKSKLRYLLLIIGSSLIFATVYLRYHYVVDLFAGILFAAAVLLIEPYLHRWITKKRANSLK